MEIGSAFDSISSYLDNMNKGLGDKLFFLSTLPSDKKYIFVDFGCSDGMLIRLLSWLSPGNIYVGYDISEAMISLAKEKSTEDSPNITYTSNWETVADIVNKNPREYKTVIVLSSVVHEIYSYAENQLVIDSSFDKIMDIADYICVRDMMCSKNLDRYSDEETYNKVIKALEGNDSYLQDFEKHWGSIKRMKNLVHFLLKYKWTINWKREVNENYFPITIEEFLKKFEQDFNLIYFERFRNPFFEANWKKDFDIKLEDYTHVKMIFQLQ